MPQRAMDGGVAMYRKYGMLQRAIDGGAGMVFLFLSWAIVSLASHHFILQSL